jgi:hypothetical protein
MSLTRLLITAVAEAVIAELIRHGANQLGHHPVRQLATRQVDAVPRDTRSPRATSCWTSSAANLVLPMPGSPSTRTTRDRPARASPAARRSTSSSRPCQ